MDDYALDVSKQQREITQMISLGNEALPGGEVPIAAQHDNHKVHRYELHKWMKTLDFEREPPMVKEAAMLHDQQHAYYEAQEQAQQMAAQTQMAQELGAANAAKPQLPKPAPDQRSADTEAA